MFKSLRTILAVLALLNWSAAQNIKISAALAQKIKSNTDNISVWIYFTDRGGSLDKSAMNLITPRAMKRREKSVQGRRYDQFDRPLYKPYMEKIEHYIQKKRVESRWLNAVSADVKGENIEKISALPFVKRVDIVHSYRRNEPTEEAGIYDLKKITGESPDDSSAYWTQIRQIKVDKLHEKGSYGQGVVICMLDDGFRLYRSHEAFESLNVIKTWDFINNDSSVDDTSYSNEGFHGSMTLSSIGAYAPGKLIGTAYKASFLLGKTEVDSSETIIEEDYWVAGLEWAEAEGADIVSSSLGYIDWYTWHDMDGKTAVTTKAAAVAEQKGVLVVNSAGNEGDCDTCNTLIAPADGENVFTIGAVDVNGSRTSFSSVGPTADGRIKPDVMALGSWVVVASYKEPHAYGFASGTSFSCPLTAGAAALLIERNPTASPKDIREAIRKTASRADNPDRFYGWGIANIDSADGYLKRLAIGEDKKINSLEDYVLKQNYPNPFNPSTRISFYLPKSDHISLEIYNPLGERIKTLVRGYYAENNYSFDWDGKNERGILQSSGIYIYSLKTSDIILTKKMVLLR